MELPLLKIDPAVQLVSSERDVSEDTLIALDVSTPEFSAALLGAQTQSQNITIPHNNKVSGDSSQLIKFDAELTFQDSADIMGVQKSKITTAQLHDTNKQQAEMAIPNIKASEPILVNVSQEFPKTASPQVGVTSPELARVPPLVSPPATLQNHNSKAINKLTPARPKRIVDTPTPAADKGLIGTKLTNTETIIMPVDRVQAVELTGQAPQLTSASITLTDVRPSLMPLAAQQQQSVSVQITSALTQDISHDKTDARAKSITVQLSPAELGRVQIRYEFDGTGRVSANIVAETPETQALLKHNPDTLIQQLKLAGFDHVELNFDAKSNLPGRDTSQQFFQHKNETSPKNLHPPEADTNHIPKPARHTMLSAQGSLDLTL